MGEMVHCEICGGLYSSSHLKSHKRLAHQKNSPVLMSNPLADQDAMRMIFTLFDGLAAKNKKHLLKHLTSRNRD
jgi:hypothetical protein